MSYIDNVLHGRQSNNKIIEFLKEEGFEKDSGPMGEKGMVYVAYGSYTVWFTVTEVDIRLYVEYDCGGEVASTDYPFEQNDFDSFKEAYIQAVNWAKSFI